MQLCLATLGAALGAGCLLPQEDTPLTDFTRPNRPPRILENTAEPAKVSTVGNGPTCRVDFAAFVEDPDIDDAITWRWYIDYDRENPDRNRPRFEGQLAPSGKALREPSVRLGVTIQDNPDFRTGMHLVTLMVFDGHLGTFDGPGSIPPPQPVPGTDAGLQYYSTTFDWVLTVDPNEVCP